MKEKQPSPAPDLLKGTTPCPEWVYVDPDHRKKIPEGYHCERCKKEMNGLDKAVSVQLSNDGYFARKKQHGGHVIGLDCWNKLVKEYGFEDITADNNPDASAPATAAELQEAKIMYVDACSKYESDLSEARKRIEQLEKEVDQLTERANIADGYSTSLEKRIEELIALLRFARNQWEAESEISSELYIKIDEAVTKYPN